jgi:hypothetical protein
MQLNGLMYGSSDLGVQSLLQTSPEINQLMLHNGCVYDPTAFYYAYADCMGTSTTPFYNGAIGEDGLLPLLQDYINSARQVMMPRAAQLAATPGDLPWLSFQTGTANLVHQIGASCASEGVVLFSMECGLLPLLMTLVRLHAPQVSITALPVCCSWRLCACRRRRRCSRPSRRPTSLSRSRRCCRYS